MTEMLQEAEKALNPNGLIFAAETQTEPFGGSPASTIAKAWDECLGRKAIPFEPVARKSLIDHGRKQPELRKHIEAWEKMKSEGSKWAK